MRLFWNEESLNFLSASLKVCCEFIHILKYLNLINPTCLLLNFVLQYPLPLLFPQIHVDKTNHSTITVQIQLCGWVLSSAFYLWVGDEFCPWRLCCEYKCRIGDICIPCWIVETIICKYYSVAVETWGCRLVCCFLTMFTGIPVFSHNVFQIGSW